MKKIDNANTKLEPNKLMNLYDTLAQLIIKQENSASKQNLDSEKFIENVEGKVSNLFEQYGIQDQTDVFIQGYRELSNKYFENLISPNKYIQYVDPGLSTALSIATLAGFAGAFYNLFSANGYSERMIAGLVFGLVCLGANMYLNSYSTKEEGVSMYKLSREFDVDKNQLFNKTFSAIEL
jgi:hypothetical protein